ncbi:MAG: sensor histidine kinase [Ilumatobacteraceae bacterium]
MAVLVIGTFIVSGLLGAVIGRAVERRALAGRPVLHRSTKNAAPPVVLADLDQVVGPHRVGVVLIGDDAQVRYRNAAALRFRGTHIGVLLDENVERLGGDARRGTRRSETAEFYGPPRSVFVIDAHPLPDGMAVVYVDDVSEEHRLDRMRTDFVTNISHELKTPIGAMSVLAEALEGESDEATIHRVVGRMIVEAARAGRTVDDLLELSRIELSRPGASGDDSIDRVTVDQVVETAIGRVTELALGRSIGVTALAPVDGSGHRVGAAVLHGDRRQLESALGNLVENAVRYSGDGGSVQIRSSVEGEVVEFTVVDHGIGIPQRDLDRIFERFYRVDRARSRDTGGTGLGLSIVRHVANNHGGTVSVRSTEGEGSTFVLRLPIVVETGPDTGRAEREGVA